MEINHELKGIDIKIYICYYFDDIIKIGFDFDNVLIEETSSKIFCLIIFVTKPWLVQNHCDLGLIK